MTKVNFAASREAAEKKGVLGKGEYLKLQEVTMMSDRGTYSVGHLLILPYRQVGDLEDLDADETTELWATVTNAVRAVKAGLAPGGVNVGLNLGQPAGGSVTEHLHVHVVPRWVGDANFMTATGNTRTLPEALPDTAARLRKAWPAA